MGETTIWTGLPGSGRATAAVELALANSYQGRLTWWIVDSRTRSDRVERSLMQASPGGVAGVEVILERGVAQLILDSAADPHSAVSPAMRELVFRALLGESVLHDRLAAPDSAGWAAKASQLYDRTNGNAANPINLDRIRTVIPWLNELFLRYDRWLEEHDLVDEALLPSLALNEIERDVVELPHLLIIDRMPEPSEAAIQLLLRVSELSKQTTVLMDSTREAPAANLGRWFVERLDEKCDWTEKPFPSLEERASFASRIFASPGITNPSPVDTEIWFHRDEASEIATVIRDAADWVHGQHLSEDDVAIVCADVGDSLPRIRELAGSYGLRLNAPLVKPMMSRPLTALLMDLVKLRTGGLDRARLTSLLVNPLVKYGDLLRNSSNVMLLDSVARKAGIRGGRGGFGRVWATPLQSGIDYHRIGYRKSDDLELDERRRQTVENEADRLQSMLGELRALNDLLHALPNPCTPVELRNWVDDCLRELGVFAAIHMSNGKHDDLDERLTYGRLDILLNNLAKLQGVGGERRSLATWSDLLHQGLRRMTVSKPQRIRCGVQVLNATDLPGLRCK
ncbi:MAG TPA: hypothetical protein ENH10_07905, partial [Bacteroidetes bacterium]|nr:hypothetical protein [Bacteroidota bacterium]HEX05061.1 hypothetical protein [Bacteroidota bacterium]